MSKCNSITNNGVRCNRNALPGRRYCWQHESKLFKGFSIGTFTAVILTIISLVADLSELGVPVPSFKSISERTTPTPSLSTSIKRIGISPGNSNIFFLYPNYDPSGYMGDSGDITVEKSPNMVRFIYETIGRGPHEWEWKYASNNLAKFAGVMYLNPPNNWGTESNGGFDLRGFHIVKWEARSISGIVNVEFIIGGVVWKWNDEKKERVSVPYPDSMIRTTFGIKTLTEDWQSFEADLSYLPEDNFRCVIGGFAWIISWESNHIQINSIRTSSDQPKKFTIEIRNIQYGR